jgi:hypothetical protein
LDYLRWRYLGNPEKTYSLYVCEENNEIIGYSVLSIERNTVEQRFLNAKLCVGNIVDLLTLPNKNYAAVHLVANMFGHFERDEVNIVSCWMFRGHPYYAILHRFGFSEYYELLRRCVFRPKYVPQFIVYVNSRTAVQKASELKGGKGLYWFIVPGDSDFA